MARIMLRRCVTFCVTFQGLIPIPVLVVREENNDRNHNTAKKEEGNKKLNDCYCSFEWAPIRVKVGRTLKCKSVHKLALIQCLNI